MCPWFFGLHIPFQGIYFYCFSLICLFPTSRWLRISHKIPCLQFFCNSYSKRNRNALQNWLNTTAMQLASVIILGSNEYTTSLPCTPKGKNFPHTNMQMHMKTCSLVKTLIECPHTNMQTHMKTCTHCENTHSWVGTLGSDYILDMSQKLWQHPKLSLKLGYLSISSVSVPEANINNHSITFSFNE